VTDFWDNPDKPELEVQCGKNLCDCIKESKVEHFVFSTLPKAKDCLNKTVEPFDNKCEISNYAKSLKLPLSQICLSFYYENFETRLKPNVLEDGTVCFELPIGDKKLSMISAGDVGGIVMEIFKKKRRIFGKMFSINWRLSNW